MTKIESQIMKGVAILLMIFLHLFNMPSNVALCDNLIFINGIPFVEILSRATSPVAFFLILGGYGLYKVWLIGDRNRWSRLFKLFFHWWIIMTIFVAIGHFLYPDRFPGNLIKFILNGVGYLTSYNSEMWFLLPYVILSASAPWLFKVMNRFSPIGVIAATLCLHILTSFTISRYGSIYLFSHPFEYNVLLPFHLLFNFSLGAMAARCNFFERLKLSTSNIPHRGIIMGGGIIILVSISCVFKYNFFYAFLFISFFLLIPLPELIKKTLVKLGDNSMNMWMIHSWFCYHLFHNFIYSFKFPILIFLILTVISYVFSLIINYITNPMETLFLTKKQIKEKPML